MDLFVFSGDNVKWCLLTLSKPIAYWINDKHSKVKENTSTQLTIASHPDPADRRELL